MKKGKSKEGKQALIEIEFSKLHWKRGRRLEIWLRGILIIQCFCHAADNPQLIKVSMIYLYIKPEVKKHDSTVKTTSINEACIGWLHEIAISWVEFFFCEK